MICCISPKRHRQLTPVLKPGFVPEFWPGSRGSHQLVEAAKEKGSLGQGLVVCSQLGVTESEETAVYCVQPLNLPRLTWAEPTQCISIQ